MPLLRTRRNQFVSRATLRNALASYRSLGEEGFSIGRVMVRKVMRTPLCSSFRRQPTIVLNRPLLTL